MPGAADVYLLANVVHNWDDEEALRLLRIVRSVVPEHGRVLFVDAVLPDDDEPHMGKDLDMRMLSLFGGGGERTKSGYFALLKEAGLVAERTTELPMGLSLVEATPG